MDTPWLDRVRALLDPVQFDRRPSDGLDRVFLRTFGAGTTPQAAAAWRHDIRLALACETPLRSLLPLAHEEGDVRAYLEAVAHRLQARFPAAVVDPPAPPPPLRHPAVAQLLAACDAIDAGQAADPLLATLESTLEEAIGELETAEMDEALTPRDLELQGLAFLLQACLGLSDDETDTASARRYAAEADLLLRAAAPP